MYNIYDEDFSAYLEIIISNLDDTKVVGIAKQFLDNGARGISEKQEFILRKGISEYILDECPNCGETISFADMPFALDNNLCNTCQRDWDKNYID